MDTSVAVIESPMTSDSCHWNAITLGYTRWGQGAPLLLLHGLGGNGENWYYQSRAFSRDREVITVDLPGHGRSSGRLVPFGDYWQAIEAVLDHLSLEKVSICGLSKGARAGIAFAARHPERVERIAIVAAFLRLEHTDREARLSLYDLLVAPGGPRRWADALLSQMSVCDHPAIVRGFHRSLDHIDPAHIRRIFGELLDHDQREEFASLTCPVLLMRGDRDAFVPAYCLEEMLMLQPKAEVVRFPALGHLPYLEDSASINTALERFLP